MPPEVVFVVSNDRHHPAMVEPVIARLTESRDAVCTVLSLCELRGRPSPTAVFAAIGVNCQRVLPFNLRRGPVARGVSASKATAVRHGRVQELAWRFFVGPRLEALLRPAPALVVLPNDAAYPFDRIARRLGERKVPYLLLQEGIRFELPGVPRARAYGSGGAAAVAVWGESSVEYFRGVGVAAERIVVTGNPRFDRLGGLGGLRRSPAVTPERSRARPKRLLLVTNPIDEQGFCSSEQKLALVRSFLDEIAPLVEDRTLDVKLKLHASESSADYRRALTGCAVLDRIEIAEEESLFGLLQQTDAAVIMASTVGLEALLFDLALGVLELPGTGFVFDYVRDGAALGLSWSQPMASQVRNLLDYHSSEAARFLMKHLHRSPTRPASETVARLVVDLATTNP